MSSSAPEEASIFMAASAAQVNDDADIARRLVAVEQLTSIFGFDLRVAAQAVDNVGTDVTECYNFILDQGLGNDKGGLVNPIDNCRHVKDHVKLSTDDLPQRPHTLPCTHFTDAACALIGSRPAQAKAEVQEDGNCPSVENWLCLECGVVRCSRYVNAHAVAHWKETQQKEEIGFVDESTAVAAGLSDLSIWCHVCASYLRFPPSLEPLLRRLEDLKFEEDINSQTAEPDRKKARPSDEPDHRGSPAESSNNASDAEDGGEEEESCSRSDEESESEGVDDEEESHETEDPPVVDLNGMDDNALMQLLASVAHTRGIPLSLLIQQDDENVEYPFESLPTNLQEVGQFIQSEQCQKILVLAGAGMSVSSGIPDYRSADGFYASLEADALTASPAEQQAIRNDPTVALQKDTFLNNPLPCLELKRDFILGTHSQRWKATLAHRFLELLHRKTNKVARVYTQNIDGLEDQCLDLPRSKVIRVHGTMDRAECASCGMEADYDSFCEHVRSQIKDLTMQDPSAPHESSPIECTECGQAAMKPAIVLFRSSLPAVFFESLPGDVEDVDLLIVLGTSLQVAPANSLVWRVPKSAMRLLINREPVGEHLGMFFGNRSTKRDYHAAGDCEDVVLDLMEHLGWLPEIGHLAGNGQLPACSAEKLKERLSRLSVE
jgi:NAD+-dependent protein deacetylase sirtuin 2